MVPVDTQGPDEIQPVAPQGDVQPITENQPTTLEEVITMPETVDNPELTKPAVKNVVTFEAVRVLQVAMLALNPSMRSIHDDVMKKFCTQILECNSISTGTVAGVNFTNLTFKE